MFYRLIDRPVSVLAVLIMLVVPGIIAVRMFPVSLLPDIDVPLITVSVNAPGMDAAHISSQLIAPLANHFGQIENVEEMECRSIDGSGSIVLRFGFEGRNGKWKFIEVNEQVDRAMSSWPEGVERPLVAKSGVADIPSFFINVTCSDGQDDFAGLSDLVRNVVSRRLEQLPEIAMVDVSGMVESEVTVRPDPARMRALGIDPKMLESAITDAGMDIGSIHVQESGLIYEIGFEREVVSIDDIKEVWLNIGGRLFLLSELATVSEHTAPQEGMVLSDGRQAVTIAVVKNNGSSMGRLRREVNALIESMESDYPSLQFQITRDQTGLLDYSISNMLKNLVSGALFACLVLFFFYRNLISPLMTLVSVPLSLAVSALVLYVWGISINLLSLSGLVLGIGMMVDNSIIAVGNITRRHNAGETLRDACVMGTREVFAPLLSSLLTTCSMFLPLAFLSGIAGALFHDEAVSVTVTLFSSLAVSVLVLPVLLFSVKHIKTITDHHRQFPVVHRCYQSVLNWFFRNRWAIWGIFTVFMVLLNYYLPHIPFRKMPDMTRDETLVLVDWNRPVSPTESSGICEMACRETDALHCTIMSGPQDFVLTHTPVLNQERSLIYVKCSDQQSLSRAVDRIETALVSRWPGVQIQQLASGNVMDMLFPDSGDRVVVRLKPVNPDVETYDRAASLVARLDSMFPHAGLEPPSFVSKLMVRPRPEMLEFHGISKEALEAAVSDRTDRNPFMMLSRGNYAVPVLLESDEERSMLDFLWEGHMKNSAGIDVPLSELVSLSWNRVPKEYWFGPEGEYIPVPMNDLDNVYSALSQIRRTVAGDGHFTVNFSGTYFSGHSLVSEMISVLLISIMLLYLILAAQFGNMVQPLLVMFELVADIGFVLLVLFVSGQSLNVMSMTGLVVMCGIVINDSILKVDTINRLVSQGVGILRAVLQAGQIRNGAIVMTSVTTILAMAPFLVRGDMGSDLQFPLSLAIVSGLFMGTLVSIFIVPVACYSWLYKKQASGTSQLRSSLNKI